ncbi:hypothetical protein OB69_01085 [Roseivirga seohaensis subsp. aquiponti]|uniref:Uncharacterized protein n=1 Tax=Roseivirga seohaensis subsp. aquiponti TaxID=1566026 RepID=A0A0L8AQ09_9BACT|nr:hypothetical protein [Roseivirga seohaensis]KOF04424.1 hypothetical protein OB69_01085 [Roseivirga seohaensis subsp. aquiponti]
MKATIATILLALLTLPFGGTYLFLEMERAKAKQHAALAIANEENPVEMVHLAFTEAQMKSDLRWEHDGEFEYKDQMYDIISREVKGDTTYFYAYWDKLESIVNHKLNELIALHFGGKSDQQDDSQLVVSLVKALYIQPSVQSTTFIKPIVSTQFFEIEMTYDPRSQGVDGPPPRYNV